MEKDRENGNITEEEFKSSFAEKCSEIEAEVRRTFNVRQEDEPSVLIGRQAGPIKRGQVVCEVDPTKVTDAEDLSLAVDSAFFKPLKLRFDNNFIAAVERILLEARGPFSAHHYEAFSIKKIRKGYADTDEYEWKGRKYKTFSFSFGYKWIPYLFNALRRLVEQEAMPQVPSCKELAEEERDEHGILDITRYTEPVYSRKMLKFGIYYVWIAMATSKNSAGAEYQYLALHIAKEKSAEAMKNKKAGHSPFFLLQLPIKVVSPLLITIEQVMYECRIKEIPLLDNNAVKGLDCEDEEALYVSFVNDPARCIGSRKKMSLPLRATSLSANTESGFGGDEGFHEEAGSRSGGGEEGRGKRMRNNPPPPPAPAKKVEFSSPTDGEDEGIEEDG